MRLSMLAVTVNGLAYWTTLPAASVAVAIRV
jgi:hypothetical protein